MGLFAREFIGKKMGLPPMGAAGIVARAVNKKFFKGKKKKKAEPSAEPIIQSSAPTRYGDLQG